MIKYGTLGLLFLLLLAVSPAQAANDLNSKIDELVVRLTTSLAGKVVKGSETEVYIALGQEDGVIEGTRFEVIRRGEPLKVGDEIIGYEETPIAHVEATRVRERLSICQIVEASGIPQPDDWAYQQRKQVKRILIGQFVYNQGTNSLTKNIQEKLVTAMTGKGMQVVERDQLERVLKEQKLGYSGLVNTSTAMKIGELFGAEGMLLGSISDLGNDIAINARLVDVQNGNAISAAEVGMPKTPMIAELLAAMSEEIVNPGPEVGTTQASSSKTSKKQVAKSLVEVADGYEFALQTCAVEAGGVVCEFEITNTQMDRKLYVRTDGRFFDSSGNVFKTNGIQVGNQHIGNGGWLYFVKDVHVKSKVSFSKVPPDTDIASLLEITTGDFTIQFRNVPIHN